MSPVAGRPDVLVGLISDTHGRLHPGVAEVFAGVDHIIHAGDVGPGLILEELEAIARVTAVAGNVDIEFPAASLPAVARVTVADTRFLIAHVLEDVERSFGTHPADADVVVYGHSHVPSIERRGAVLFVNPGSATRGRRASGRNVALLSVVSGAVSVEIRPLDVR